jgi:hypothetical protein
LVLGIQEPGFAEHDEVFFQLVNLPCGESIDIWEELHPLNNYIILK